MSGEQDRAACCEHGLIWHHETRGCGYYGFSGNGRCPCLLTFDEALADLIAQAEQRGRVEALREAADECHKEARWQQERGRRPRATPMLHLYVEGRVSLVEQCLRERADWIEREGDS